MDAFGPNGAMSANEDLVNSPQPGQLIYVDEVKESIAIATVIRQLGTPNSPRFDVALVDGSRAVVQWVSGQSADGHWRAASKGPSAAT